jgi:glucose/arabinose dehydrogenase
MRSLLLFRVPSLFLASLLLGRIVCAEPVTDPIPARIAKSEITVELQPIAEGLASPVLLVGSPDTSGRVFVIDQSGLVRVVENGALRTEPFLNVTDRLVKLNKDFDERGLLGLAFDPAFRDAQGPGRGRLLTYMSEPIAGRGDFPNPHAQGVPPDHQSVIASWRVTADGSRVDPATRKELLRIDEPQFNHNAGMIAFGPDGFLYIALGDGGAGNDLGPGHNPEIGNGQDKTTVLGKMLRIDVNGTDSANGAYGIPRDNPFAAGGGVREIFALGLRNPWRFSFDGATLLVGDVGQNKLEWVHRVERGGNYGWRLKEGTFKFNTNGTIEPPDATLPAGLRDPVLQYDHDEGISIIGGCVYRGRAIPALAGKYVFGDYRHAMKTNTGRLFVGDLASGEIRELRIGSKDRELGFLLKGIGRDAEGELYLCGSKEPGPLGTGGVVVKLLGMPVE